MIVYSGLKSDFLTAVEQDSIATEIEETIYKKMHRRTAQNEFRSWENSLEYMYKVLNDNAIPSDSGVAIEYNIPQTSKRVDFIISGYGEKQNPNVVIIELKQWDKVEAVDGQDALVETYTGGAVRKVVHPSYQAWSYAAMIYDYNQNVQMGNIILHPCAYLHNYRKSNPEKLEQKQYKEYVKDAPVFARGEALKLREFIKKSVKVGDNKQLLYDIDSGKIKPSKSLQNAIKSMIEGNQEFIMLDEQKVVYEEILKTALLCMNDQKKRTIIVKGGPGTGKTVVAINLLAKLTNEGLFAQYTSKNSAPRNVYAKKLVGHKKSSINNMFKGAGSYILAANVGLSYRSNNNIFLSADFNYYNNMYLSMSPIYRTDAVITTGMTAEDIAHLRRQEKFDSAYTLNASIGKNWYIHRQYTLGFSLEVKNILNNQDIRTGGYEQTRLTKNTETTVTTYQAFDSKYFYMFGTTYYLNLYFRF